MSNKSAGQEAEGVAAEYLIGLGYEIIDRNWRTQRCEIDVVASKQNRIYFVEVKSRRNPYQGSGLDYITASKLRQMSLAAEIWVSTYGWTGEYQLSALSIDSDSITFIQDIN